MLQTGGGASVVYCAKPKQEINKKDLKQTHWA